MLHHELKDALTEQENFAEIVGQQKAKEQISSALLSGRHIIIIGPPGVGKTTMAKSIASILPEKSAALCGYGNTGKEKIPGEQRFIRVQGSPDLTAEDLIGDIDPVKALKFGASSIEAFSPGKVFLAHNGMLFFDEINRAPERLQNALLQVLEEKEVTIGSYRMNVHADFILIATLNPEDTNTEKLSSVFLDRFDVVEMSYPEDEEKEKHIVKEKARQQTTDVVFPEILLQQAINIVRELRIHPKVERAPGVRASIGLYERAISMAILRQHKEVTYTDLYDVLRSVLAHRIELKPSIRYTTSPEQFLEEEIKKKKIAQGYENQSGDEG